MMMYMNFLPVSQGHENVELLLQKSHGKDPCHMSSNGYMITYGIAEVIFSQIPDFDQVWWLSMVAAINFFTNSIVGLGLGVGKVAGTSRFILYVHAIYLRH